MLVLLVVNCLLNILSKKYFTLFKYFVEKKISKKKILSQQSQFRSIIILNTKKLGGINLITCENIGITHNKNIFMCYELVNNLTVNTRFHI